MAEYLTLAAVDLGSNSFHCQIARVVGEQLYPLDALREPVRLAADVVPGNLGS
jgi:exopolyphosphatase/guanosine-5'-triphosphate,3'-diphosphate pyrophosphatase